MLRVAITSIGIVSPLGLELEKFWLAVGGGESEFSAIERFSTAPYGVYRAAGIGEFVPFQPPKAKQPWTNTRATQFALMAARKAIDNSGIVFDETVRHETGVALGSTIACQDLVRELDVQGIAGNPKTIDPLLFPDASPSAPSCRISLQLGVDCFNTIVSNGACSGLDAIRHGALAIQLGRARMALAGGVEELTRETFVYYAAMGDLAGGEDSLCRPFDKRRSGALLGEGAVVLLLEEYEHARARNARIIAEICGYGACYWPPAGAKGASSGDGPHFAMRQALADAGIDRGDVDVIFANASGSVAGDAREYSALAELYGEAEMPPITAVKSSLGELNSASGAVQAAICALSLRDGLVPPTLHYQEQDPACPVPSLVKRPVKRRLEVGLVNAFSTTPGSGACSSLVLRAA